MDHLDEGAGEYVLRELAEALWVAYPDPLACALLTPSETFPEGTLLGRFRLDPLDPAVVHGPPIDVLEVDLGEPYAAIREQLLARALQASLLSDEVLGGLLDVVEKTCCGPWDAPWQLIGLIPTSIVGDGVEELETLFGGSGSVLGTVTAVHLVPAGQGHPEPGLRGLIAPPPVFGLVLVSEGYERDDAGNRIGEVRMHLVVLADGRWGLRQIRRPDSSHRPRPESTVGGVPVASLISEDMSEEPEPFSSASPDSLGGVLPETLARVLQVSVQPGADPYEIVLRLLARSAASVVEHGGNIADVARVDPTSIACIGAELLERAASSVHEGGKFSEEEVLDAMDAFAESLGERAAAGGDWLTEEMLTRIEPFHALHASAGAYRVVEAIDDVTAAWLGSELLAGRVAELAGPVADSLAELRSRNRVIARQVASVVAHRRAAWGVSDTDAMIAAVRMPLTVSQGRNDLCRCGSGRKFKHCCLARPR